MAVALWMFYAEKVIQAFIFSIIAFGWYLSTFHVGVDWLIRRNSSNILGVIYLLSVNLLVASVSGLYIYLISGQQKHNVALYPLPDKSLLTEPYHCTNETGDLDVCLKGACAGKWKPPRTHHCSTCGVCRLEFDHHCPWVGNCITLSNMKAFLCMLFLLPITFITAISPVFSILVSHTLLALSISRQDPWANQIWWNWTGSWIICAGPFGRWIGGTILGFMIIGNNRRKDKPHLPGYIIEEPHLRMVITAGVVLLLSCFSLGLGIGSLRRILKGVTTFETLRRPPKSFICIPQTSNNQDICARVLPNERVYDLGPLSNWQLFTGRHLLVIPVPSYYIWPKINPAVIHRIRSLQSTTEDSLVMT